MVRIAVVGWLLVTFAALAATACGGSEAKPVDVAVTLQEWSIATSQEVVKPGEVVFTVTNAGTMPHGLLIIKSDLPPDGLQVADGKVDEKAVNIVGQIQPFDAGTTQTLQLKMTPGKYLLISNVVQGEPPESDYLNGMVAPLLLED